MSVPDYTLEDTLDFKFTTRRFSTGAPFAFASGAIEIYEDNDIAQITGADDLTLEFDGVTGLHNLRVAATAANGFENGKSYHCVVSAGTVDSVSVVGEVVQQFTLGRSAAAVDLANGIDGLTILKSQTAAILNDTGTTLDGIVDNILLDTEAIRPDATNTFADTEAIRTDTEATIVDTEAATGVIADTENIVADTESGTFGLAALLADTEATRTDAAAIIIDTEAATGVIADTENIVSDTESGTFGLAALLADTEATVTDTESGTHGLAILLADTEATRTDAAAIIIDTEAATGVISDTEAILVDTDTTIPALLPAALVGGRMDSNVSAINNVAGSAPLLEASISTNLSGVASGTPTTTTMISDITVTVNDQFNGRTIIFDNDTTTTALQGQATDLSGATASTDTLTFTALTTAPVSGEKFQIV